MSESEEIKLILQRERLARKEAERILEQKSLEIYNQSEKIQALEIDLRKKTEQELQILNSKQKILDGLFDQHPFAIIIYNRLGHQILAVNDSCKHKFGYTENELLTMTVEQLHIPQDRDRLKKHLKQIESQNSTGQIWTMCGKGVDTFVMRITGSSTYYKGIEARIIILEDITEHEELKEKSSYHESQYKSLIEKSSDIIYTINRGGYFTYMNPTGLKILEFEEDEILKTNFKDLIREDFRERVASFYKFQYESKTPTTYTEFPVLSKSGNIFWLGQNVDMKFSDDKVEISTIARDITEKKRYEKELQRSEEKYKSIINNLELGLLEVDMAGIIKNAHPSFCKMVGYNKEEIEGTNGEFLLDEKGHQIMLKQRSNRTKGSPGVYEIQLITKSGDPIWVMISGAPTYDNNNQMTGSIGIHLNITQQKKLETELRSSVAFAEESLRTKELFLANISHEMRTPLNGIIGLSELLNEEELTNQQRSKTSSILVSSKNLLALIDDLLLLTKIENKKLEIHPTFVNLKSSIDELVQVHLHVAAEKNLAFINRNEIDEEFSYYLDVNRLNQILNNLISNAIKFTKNGCVTIHTKIAYSTRSYDAIEIEVKDTGIGIPENEIDKVFGSFQQASNNNTNVNGGTGLGLSIVHELVQLMGGSIDLVTSNKGTSFFLEFEFQKSKTTAQEKNQNQSEIQFSDLHILVAEDNETNQLLIKTILEKWSVATTIVSNGLDAVNEFKKNRFDIVLMDLRMPVMNGTEALQLIRQFNSEVPIIAVTANATGSDKNEYLELGFTDLLSKPFVQRDLQLLLQEYANNKDSEIQEKLMEVTNGDADFAVQLGKIFYEDSLKRVELLRTAITEENINEINSICHSMKPSILQLGDIEVRKLVLQLETYKLFTPEVETKTQLFIEKTEEMCDLLSRKIIPNLEFMSQNETD